MHRVIVYLLLNLVCVGLEVQMLVAFTGSHSNPQNKIISALAKVTRGSWTMK
jgi:hypothetical protein